MSPVYANRKALTCSPVFTSGYLKGVEGVPRGTVKWFGPDEGYGVIVRDGGEPDAVVQLSAIQVCCRARGLMAGDEVSFDVIADSDGIRAENVRRTDAGCRASRVGDSP